MSDHPTSTSMQEFQQQITQLGKSAAATEMSDDERVVRAKRQFLAGIDRVMAIDMEACIHCGMCAEVCHFHLATEDPRYAPVRKYELLRRVYRRELSPMRWLWRAFARDITADELREWQELVYDSCTACGRCDMVCPMGISISETVRVMREGLAAAGLVPDEMRALEQEQHDHGTLFGVGPEQLRQAIARLKQDGVDVPLDKKRADVMVLSSALNLKLFSASLGATAKIMNHLGIDWTMRSDAFDANNYGYLTGNREAQHRQTQRLVDAATACGAMTVIVPECGHSYPALRWAGANQMQAALPFEVLAISEFIGNQIRDGRLKVGNHLKGKTVTFHDPCRVGRHGGVLEEPREALAALGVDLREPAVHRRANICCGGGEGVNWIGRAEDLRQHAFMLKREEFDNTGAESVVTSCDSCRYNFMSAAEKTNWPMKIESLVELVAENLDD